MKIKSNQISFTNIANGKWQANIDGQRISSATIVGGKGVWALQGQRSAETLARFRTRLDAATYQLNCVHAESQTN